MENQNLKKIRSRSIYSIKKADIILIVGCLLAAFFVGVFFILNRGEGSVARISCDGVEVAVIAFGESGQEKFYLIRNAGGNVMMEIFDEYPPLPEESFNLLSVVDGKVSMVAADCRDQICVRHRPVSDDGESIICLPHRFVVEIMEDAEGSDDHTRRPYSRQDENTEEALDGMVE